MNLVVIFAVGGLFGVATYLMLRRSPVKLVVGLVVLSNAANLAIFAAGGLRAEAPPLIPEGAEQPYVTPAADPLPQALILTAIVISLGVLAFGIGLISQAHLRLGVTDIDQLDGTDRVEPWDS
jgi:multicomponent Na+:H+ antiporter subunit C